MAIKYAGLYGKEVHIIGKNRETLNAAAAKLEPTLDGLSDGAQEWRVNGRTYETTLPEPKAWKTK